MTTATAQAKLAALGLAVLKAHRCDGGCDIDGGHLQELATESGALERRTATESCGQGCVCSGMCDFPTECFFVADDVQPLMEN